MDLCLMPSGPVNIRVEDETVELRAILNPREFHTARKLIEKIETVMDNKVACWPIRSRVSWMEQPSDLILNVLPSESSDEIEFSIFDREASMRPEMVELVCLGRGLFESSSYHELPFEAL